MSGGQILCNAEMHSAEKVEDFIGSEGAVLLALLEDHIEEIPGE